MAQDNGPFKDQVNATITPDGKVSPDPIMVKAGGQVTWICNEGSWEVEVTRRIARGPLSDGDGYTVSGDAGQSVTSRIDPEADQHGDPRDPEKPSGARGRYPFDVSVTVNGKATTLDPDFVIGPPQ